MRPFLLPTVLACLLAAGCGAAQEGVQAPTGARPDYQLGTAYPPADDVEILVRDRTASPVEGLYNVCYVNAFQSQPGEEQGWESAGLLLLDGGVPVVDEEWDEALLDTSTPDARQAVAEVVGGWIDGCAEDGFAAVEFDNLDSHLRSHGLLTVDDNLALASLLVDRAHRAGLAAGQKNAAELVDRAREIGFDFAVAEECQEYDECDAYTEAYGRGVIQVEYADQPESNLAESCAARGGEISVVRRDRDLVAPGEEGYLAQWCDRG
ncbi:hypothetical protein BW730_05565 [Tessaracoccus aquimaris]|uniref:Glycoside-hydrolase family GH114 TIM-barrel domain-containing protein n=1 Tax=Tessaracoccus aquimaris TaxID=1332264 RepID=A0A1Q2CLS4_9ACTN|nr:endo alpha-1,4 polygalactosaminidase [Tessaracoccus aquimaris]AQP47063.1 hypothetical protein BW730_05565 [Tessaracoccus aquimaris]